MSFFSSMFSMFGDFGIFILKALAVVVCPFIISCIVWLIIYYAQGKRPHKRTVKQVSNKYIKPPNILKRFYIDFPHALINDRFESDPDTFDIFGVHIFAGEQGSGKSIAMMHFIKMIIERNPACKVASNININFQDDTISDWTDILRLNNGYKGQVICLDEIQNWFSSNESKNFPVEMLSEITQQRKQRKIIVGTSQVFTRISKPIREQITMLYKPLTICGCFTVVRVYRPLVNSSGDLDKLKFVRAYSFVHDDELRNSYDTFEKVKRISVVGFQDRDKLSADNKSVTNVFINNSKRGRN